MRTLKFRAWHNEEGYMVESDRGVYTALQHVLGVTVGSGFSNCDMSAKPLRYTVQQFIGMTDRNGKEIYEGDIVLAINNFRGEEGSIRFNAKVIFNTNISAFQISYLNIDNRFVHDSITSYFLEVIGNIFQTPGLLKQA